MSDKSIESNSTGNDSDQDFDPTVDMLDGKDFDDEHTLEEEEALEEENNSNELNDLQRESEMPIEELLALYRGNMTDNVTSTIEDEEVEDEEDLNNETINECSSAIENVPKKLTNSESSTSQLDNHDKLTNESLKFDNKIEPLPVSSNLSRLISTSDDALFEISEEDDDEDDTPEDSWRRAVKIGDEYQATIPNTILKDTEKLMKTFNSLENCLQLWNPKQLDERKVEEYLKIYLTNGSQFNLISNSNVDLNESLNELSEPTDSQVTKSSINSKLSNNEISSTTNQFDSLIQRDDELALYLLLKNDFKIKDALKCKNNLDKETIDLFAFIRSWPENECLLFEDGLRAHGKDFHQIQKNKLPHKIVNELVNFYYLWKKTERHDVFTTKFKFEKRRYPLNPMTTDLMDHFLDDQPQQQLNQTSFNSTTSSLNNSITITHGSKLSSLTLLPSSNHQSKTSEISSTDLTTNTKNLDSIEDNSDMSSQSSGLVINDDEPQQNALSRIKTPMKPKNNDLEASTLNENLSSNLPIATNNSEVLN